MVVLHSGLPGRDAGRGVGTPPRRAGRCWPGRCSRWSRLAGAALVVHRDPGPALEHPGDRGARPAAASTAGPYRFLLAPQLRRRRRRGGRAAAGARRLDHRARSSRCSTPSLLTVRIRRRERRARAPCPAGPPMRDLLVAGGRPGRPGHRAVRRPGRPRRGRREPRGGRHRQGLRRGPDARAPSRRWPSSASTRDGHPLTGIRYTDGGRRCRGALPVRARAAGCAVRPCTLALRAAVAAAGVQIDHRAVRAVEDRRRPRARRRRAGPLPDRRRRPALAGAPAGRPGRAGRAAAAASACAATSPSRPGPRWSRCTGRGPPGGLRDAGRPTDLRRHRGAERRAAAARGPTSPGCRPWRARLHGRPRGRARPRCRAAAAALPTPGRRPGAARRRRGRLRRRAHRRGHRRSAWPRRGPRSTAVVAGRPDGVRARLAPARLAARPAHPGPAHRDPAPGCAAASGAGGGRALPRRLRRRGQPAREAGMSGPDPDVELGGAPRRATAGPSARTPKAAVHGTDTPLHLAFSCYVFDADGRLLLTQRALSQADLAGRVDQHLSAATRRPASRSRDAVRRRVPAGARRSRWTTCALLLPAFRYRAVMANGVVENEMCPVFVATTAGPVRPTRPRSRTHLGRPGRTSGPTCSTAGRRQPVVRRAGRAAPGGAAGRAGRGPGPAAPGRPRRRGAGRPRAAAGHRGGRGLPDRPGPRRDPGPGPLPRRRRRGRVPRRLRRTGPASRWPGSCRVRRRTCSAATTSGWAGSGWCAPQEETELAGIQLRPDAQGRGLGTALVRSLQEEGRPVTLGVERDNPRARALYERLGFALVGQDDRDHLLRWEPPTG